MKENEESSIPGRVLVEPIEFVDLREIAKGKHGSHRASPERELHEKRATKAISPSHQDHSYNCLQIALQEGGTSPMRKAHKVVSPRPPVSPRAPSKDEVLSVVIQKLTELVKNSEQKQKDDLDLSSEDGSECGEDTVNNKEGGATRLYQCPNCPCLFAVKNRKKGQLCSCCMQDSRSTSPEEASIEAEDPEAQCLRDGQDHGGIACDACIFKANTYNELLYHLATHNSNIFRCKFCNFVTTRHAAIEDHQAVHVNKNVKKCVCNICGFTSSEFSSLQVHIKNEHQNIKEILMKCSECGYSTRSESGLRKHMWSHVHPDENLHSPGQTDHETRRRKSTSPVRSDGDESIKSGLAVVGRKEAKKIVQPADMQDPNTKLFKCLLCGYLCEKLSTLKAHAWRHAGQEGCSYPVMHKVQDACEAIAEEISGNQLAISGNQEMSGDQMEISGNQMDISGNQMAASGNQNEPSNVNNIYLDVKEEMAITEYLVDSPKTKTIKLNVKSKCMDVTEKMDVAQDVPNVHVGDRPPQKHIRLKIKSKCQCSPIVLPEEEHSIVQKVFADATSVEPDGRGTVSSTTDASQEASDCPTSSTVDVIQNVTDKTNDFCVVNSLSVESQPLRNSSVSGQSQIIGSDMEPAHHSIPPSITDVVVVEEVVVTANEQFTVEQDCDIPTEHGHCDEIKKSESVKREVPNSVELDVKEDIVEKKPVRNQKRKISCCSPSQDTKKVCTKPGISKMLLSAVDDALQVRADQEKVVQDSSSNSTVKTKDSNEVKSITASSQLNSEDHYQCPICKKMFPSSVQTHVCSQGSTPIFKCHRCPATFWHPGRLQYHMATHEAILKCSDCPFSCSSEIALRDHVKKVHLPAKSSICPTCHREIGDQSPKDHEQSCVLKCWYGCRECDFVVNSVGELQAHVRETHQKPYKCGMCDYSSATANGIKNHMKFHNADKPYKCHLCDFSGAYPQSLRSHMKKHTASSTSSYNDQYKCKFCSYVSGHLPSMKSHMWRHSSHPGYDYDGQDIIKMVIKVKDGDEKGNQEEKSPESPNQSSSEITVEASQKNTAKESKVSAASPSVAASEKPKESQKSKQIQYGSVIFQCSQCGFKSTNHSCLVEHLREHLTGTANSEKS